MRQKAELEADNEGGAISRAKDNTFADAQKHGPRGTENTLRKLQRSHGNGFVQRLIKRGTLQRSAANDQETQGVPPLVQQVLKSQGHSLDSSTQELMENRFGQDFSNVRIHTDGRAAESANAINAAAYTVGSNIVFGEGQYAPGTTEGNRVIAHELAHVSQQGGQAADVQGLSIGPANSPAEFEADAVADAVVSNSSVPAVSSEGADAPVRRSILGGVIGGIVGAGAGALLGGLMGGPIGAIAGGLLGAVAGLAVGDAATASRRSLTEPEKAEVRIVFGNSLNLEGVKVAEAPIMSVGGYARTLPDMIYLPRGTLTNNLSDYMSLLIHELTHVWQYQHGFSVATTLFHAVFSTYDYGGEQGLVNARREGKKFVDFNTEQQGDICRDYYDIKKGNKRTTNGTAAWDPYIAEVQGTRAGADVTGTIRGGDRFTPIA